MREREGRQWKWNKMNENSRKEEFRSWGELNVEGFCKLDSFPPLVKLPGKESASSETSSSDLLQEGNQEVGGGGDIAELKKLFPLEQVISPYSIPFIQTTTSTHSNLNHVKSKSSLRSSLG